MSQPHRHVEALNRAFQLPPAERPPVPPAEPKRCTCGTCALLNRLATLRDTPARPYLIAALEDALEFLRTGEKRSCGFAYVVTVAVAPSYGQGVVSSVVSTTRELPTAELAVGAAEALSKALRKGGAQ